VLVYRSCTVISFTSGWYTLDVSRLCCIVVAHGPVYHCGVPASSLGIYYTPPSPRYTQSHTHTHVCTHTYNIYTYIQSHACTQSPSPLLFPTTFTATPSLVPAFLLTLCSCTSIPCPTFAFNIPFLHYNPFFVRLFILFTTFYSDILLLRLPFSYFL